MILKIFNNIYYLRALAIITLLLGLYEAAHLLALTSGGQGQLAGREYSGFFLFLAFVVFRLFAAVGMWINAKWGALLAIILISLELFIIITPFSQFTISAIDFWIRIGLAFALLIYLAISWIVKSKAIHD